MCKAWKSAGSKPKNVTFAQSVAISDNLYPCSEMDEYEPFLINGYVSVSGSEEKKSVLMLRDTGAAQSLILKDVTFFPVILFWCGCVNSWY